MIRPNESKNSVVTQEQNDCCIVSEPPLTYSLGGLTYSLDSHIPSALKCPPSQTALPTQLPGRRSSTMHVGRYMAPSDQMVSPCYKRKLFLHIYLRLSPHTTPGAPYQYTGAPFLYCGAHHYQGALPALGRTTTTRALYHYWGQGRTQGGGTRARAPPMCGKK